MVYKQLALLTATAALGACVAGDRPVMIHDVRPAASEKEAVFAPAGDRFSSAANCSVYLSRLVAQLSTDSAYEAARGPYPVAEGDVRAHAIRAVDGGHQVLEYRCIGPVIEARSWTALTGGVIPFTLEDIQKMSFPQSPAPAPVQPVTEEPR